MSAGKNFTRWSVAGAALCAGLVASTSAFAGAFAVREQSSYYQGMSFAGSAAGDDLSSMFWNSAAAAAVPGINVAAHSALVVPHREIEGTDGAFVAALDPDDSGDIGDPTFIPATYANYQVNERLFLGVGLNSGYGFTTKPDNTDWAGSPLAITSKIFTVNINPNLAYKLTDTVTVGVGAQVQYTDVRVRSGGTPDDLGPLDPIEGLPGRETEGDDWGVGATAGITWKPTSRTSVGIGYRSPIDVELDGTCAGTGLTNASLGGCAPGGESVTADLTLPELVTASFSQQVGERFRLLGTVEWTNWSRLGTPQILDDGGDPVDELTLEYEDGWYFSGGVEYAWSPDTILRGGLGYEISPIKDDTRNVLLPDDERIWLSAGFSTKLSESTKLDFGYSHLFVEDSPICQPQPDCDPTNPGTLFVGEATGDIDIVTLGLTHNFGAPEPELEPLK